MASNPKNNTRYGSSPRLRGTDDNINDGQIITRFIPAPAGNGHLMAFDATITPVHPRACGERATC